MVTKTIAQAFFSAYNKADVSDTIFVNVSGAVTVNEFQNPWVEIKKMDPQPIKSVEEAYEFLKRHQSEAIRRLNERLAKV